MHLQGIQAHLQLLRAGQNPAPVLAAEQKPSPTERGTILLCTIPSMDVMAGPCFYLLPSIVGSTCEEMKSMYGKSQNMLETGGETRTCVEKSMEMLGNPGKSLGLPGKSVNNR